MHLIPCVRKHKLPCPLFSTRNSRKNCIFSVFTGAWSYKRRSSSLPPRPKPFNQSRSSIVADALPLCTTVTAWPNDEGWNRWICKISKQSFETVGFPIKIAGGIKTVWYAAWRKLVEMAWRRWWTRELLLWESRGCSQQKPIHRNDCKSFAPKT